MHEAIETQLRQAVEVSPSDDGLRWLDQRVAEIIARPRPTAGRMPRLRTFLRPLAVIAGVRGPDRDRRRGDGPPRTDRGYEPWLADGVGPGGGPGATTDEGRNDADTRASVCGQQPGDGLPVGRGPRARRIPPEQGARTSLGAPGFAVRTTASLPGAQPQAAIETDVAAIVQAWGPPEAVAGTYELTIDCLEIDASDRRHSPVESRCPIPGGSRSTCRPRPGAVMRDAGAATVEGATLTLTELRVTPAMVAYRIALRVAGHAIDDWTTMDKTVRRGDDAFTTNDGYHVTQDPADQGPNGDENEFSTGAGSAPGRRDLGDRDSTRSGTWPRGRHRGSLAQGSLDIRGGRPVGDQVGFPEQS